MYYDTLTKCSWLQAIAFLAEYVPGDTNYSVLRRNAVESAKQKYFGVNRHRTGYKSKHNRTQIVNRYESSSVQWHPPSPGESFNA